MKRHLELVTREMRRHLRSDLFFEIFPAGRYNQEFDGFRFRQKGRSVANGARGGRAAVPATNDMIEFDRIFVDIGNDDDGTRALCDDGQN